ncbi:MAG TPA: DUF885 domain-containing protein [Candidatus Didemnitutus sp.]|nr:DUF885 domain-containing protein [Candidatus Didemnitutus sp.]
MMRPTLISLLVATGFALAAPAIRADQPAWIEKSNQNAQVLLDATLKFGPEGATQIGLPQYDSMVADLEPKVNERARASLVAARDELAKRALLETDPQVHQDLEILIKSANDQIDTLDLNVKLTLNYTDVGKLIFFGEFYLLQDQVEAKRHPAAVERLRRYTGLVAGTTPMTELAKARWADVAADPKLIGPYKAQVEQDLASTTQYAAGIRKLYAKYGLDKAEGATAALDAMDKQLGDYSTWIRTTVLPRARDDAKLPPELYADNLKNVGLDISPEDLVERAELAFVEIRSEMQALAPLVAKEHGFPETDYRSVIHALKREQLGKSEVEPYYHEVLAKIEDIIRREGIVTLPDRPMIMRLASEAETAAQPAPHMDPPPLINNTGERGTFVLTMGNPGSGKNTGYDDFTFKAAAWTLTAHEGRPGHELQFAGMVERGVSLPRSLFAFNSVNVEGWGLYAEAEMRPYEPIDGQLITLQLRLMRAARAFLDPLLNLGRMNRERAHEVLVNDVCLSEAMAAQELDRYMFRAPGQATAYFYGYSRIMLLRAATELALGAKFDRHAFNDFLVGEGLLPPDLLAAAVREHFIPAQMAKK